METGASGVWKNDIKMFKIVLRRVLCNKVGKVWLNDHFLNLVLKSALRVKFGSKFGGGCYRPIRPSFRYEYTFWSNRIYVLERKNGATFTLNFTFLLQNALKRRMICQIRPILVSSHWPSKSSISVTESRKRVIFSLKKLKFSVVWEKRQKWSLLKFWGSSKSALH